MISKLQSLDRDPLPTRNRNRVSNYVKQLEQLEASAQLHRRLAGMPTKSDIVRTRNIPELVLTCNYDYD